MKKIRVGVIGIGDISDVYLNNLKNMTRSRSSPVPPVGWKKRSARPRRPPRHMLQVQKSLSIRKST